MEPTAKEENVPEPLSPEEAVSRTVQDSLAELSGGDDEILIGIEISDPGSPPQELEAVETKEVALPSEWGDLEPFEETGESVAAGADTESAPEKKAAEDRPETEETNGAPPAPSNAENTETEEKAERGAEPPPGNFEGSGIESIPEEDSARSGENFSAGDTGGQDGKEEAPSQAESETTNEKLPAAEPGQSMPEEAPSAPSIAHPAEDDGDRAGRETASARSLAEEVLEEIRLLPGKVAEAVSEKAEVLDTGKYFAAINVSLASLNEAVGEIRKRNSSEALREALESLWGGVDLAGELREIKDRLEAVAREVEKSAPEPGAAGPE